MKKHLIAAAVAAAVAVPAAAQVTVYGVLDMGYNQRSVDAGAGARTGVETKTTQIGGSGGLSSSRLGFRGTEDLGGGLKAAFVLEMGVTPDNAATPFSSSTSGTRAAWVGLSGSFGEVRVGRQNTIGKDMNDNHTAFAGGASFTQGSAVHNVTGNSSQQESATSVSMTNSTDRHSNTLTYITPVFSGAKVTVQMFQETSDANNADGKATTANNNNNVTTTTANAASTDGNAFRFDYAMGPLSVSAAMTDMKVKTEGPSASNKIELNQFGARYALGNATLFVAYADGEYTANAAQAAKVKGQDVGVTVKAGPNLTLLGSFGSGDTKTAANVKTKVDGYMLQAHYGLSKRTTAYGAYFSNELKTDGSTGTDDSTTMIGIRHTF